ncbi:SMEK domain-containing protein [Undibacterium sp. WLX3042]|uniref:SMEK domain-containing protein n=1 Tax=Undibacterium sp. WLX3042 TaxID=3412686 RepID=UPI003C2ABA7A
MPLASAKTFEEILMWLSVLRYIFKSRSKRKLYDLNKQAERFFRDILNKVENLQLEDLNEEKANAAAIDLGDKASKICIQVTAENSSTKIKDTLNGFINNELYKTYSRLVILIITEKRNYSSNFDTKGKFTFSKNSDIWDIDDLLEKIEMLKLGRAEELKEYISKELAPIVSAFAAPESLLARVEKLVDLPPLTAKKFLTHIGYEPDDGYWSDEFKKIKIFYERLKKFSRKQREYLLLIIDRGRYQATMEKIEFEFSPLN